MSFTKSVTIWCDAIESDGEPCPAWHDGMGSSSVGDVATASEGRRNGRQSGWVYRNGKDLCPDHAYGTRDA